MLILLGDVATPAAAAHVRALTAAGHAWLIPADGGQDFDALGQAIAARCAAPDPGRVDCGALVLIGLGASGAARVDPLARAWQADAQGPAGWRVRAVVTLDAGYTPPFRVMDGVWQRTGLADTGRWQVGMIQSRDDPRAGLCDASGCGVLPLSVAHGARSQPIVSACPRAGAAGEHRPTADVPDWSAWLVAAVHTLLQVREGLAPPAGSPLPPNLPTLPTLPFNACLDALERERPGAPQPPPLR